MPDFSARARRLRRVGRAYSDAVIASDLTFDMLFGPAYKGIPLVTATAAALAERHELDVPFAFNRKEPKDHGEGGPIVGGPLEGRVLIVDDVITAGTAIRESIDIIRAAGAHPAGVLLALDREERGAAQPAVGGSGGSRTVWDAGDRRNQPVGPHGPYASVRPRRRTGEHAELPGALWPHRLRHTP